jgi:SAM-dependent methyltransferase
MTTSERWLQALEARHFSDLTFQEVARSLRALSSTYVERRGGIREGAALSGAGKRAAFALFYGPLHYLLVREIVHSLDILSGSPTLIDLGCGTGSAGAAWAEACADTPQVVGIDIHPWTLTEAAWTYREFGLRAKTVRADVVTATLPKSPAMILAAFTVNELSDEGRGALLPRLIEHAKQGDRVLIVEPLARSVARWWSGWEQEFGAAGGRADEWRFDVDLPPLVAKLDRAAGLKHSQLTGRSLFI